MLSDGELNHILGKWISYRPDLKAQVGNPTVMKSDINDVDPSSAHASYNAWQIKLQITWLLEYRCQPALCAQDQGSHDQEVDRSPQRSDDDPPGSEHWTR